MTTNGLPDEVIVVKTQWDDDDSSDDELDESMKLKSIDAKEGKPSNISSTIDELMHHTSSNSKPTTLSSESFIAPVIVSRAVPAHKKETMDYPDKPVQQLLPSISIDHEKIKTTSASDRDKRDLAAKVLCCEAINCFILHICGVGSCKATTIEWSIWHRI